MANTLMKWEFEELDEAMGIIPLEERVIKTTDGQIKLKIVATQKKDGGVRYQVGVYYPTSVLRMPGIDCPLPREDIYALYKMQHNIVDLQLISSGDLSEKQIKALDFIKKDILERYNTSGVQNILNTAIFDFLKYIAVFPGGVNKLEDSQGRILPDCFLMPQNSTALDFAYKLHTDLGKNFIRAIDVKNKKTIGKDYILKHLDVIEIIAK